MKGLQETRPRPRLLTSIVAPSLQPVIDPIEVRKRIANRTRALRLMARSAIGTIVVAGAAAWFYQHLTVQEQEAAIRKLVSVGTRMLSGGGHPNNPPAPIVVQLNTSILQVTSISLGHPRLAVINGRQVAEGEFVIIHTPTRSVAVSLRVLEISDRQVTLTDGTQTITAHLTMAPPNPAPSQAK
jgi:hypothetical protein